VLQFPTNVYPQNIAIDKDDYLGGGVSHLKFLFNGDFLTSVWVRIYNYSTGGVENDQIYDAISMSMSENSRSVMYYNGEQFYGSDIFRNLSNNEDYAFQMMFTQSTADGSENIYDMPVVRGNILSADGTSIMIADGISNIYEWNVSNNICSPSRLRNLVYAGMVIKIGSEQRFINSYNRETGEIVLESAFTSTPDAKSPYVIYSNYLITPQYFFMTRTFPTIAITSTDLVDYTISESIAVKPIGSYSQTNGSMIKYYIMRLYWYNREISPDSLYNWKLIAESPKIYSQKIEYYFPDALVGVDTIGNGELPTIYYKVQLEVVTQEDETVITNTSFSVVPDTTIEAIADDTFNVEIVDSNAPDYIDGAELNKHQCVMISARAMYDYRLDDYEIYRRDLETNYVTKLREICRLKIVQAPPPYQGWHYYRIYYDYTVPNRGEFEYTIVPRNKTTGVPYTKSIMSKTIKTNFMGYSITALNYMNSYEYGTPIYEIGQSWKFIGETDDTQITQNIDRVVHVGHNRYTTAVSGDVNYSSGSLSVLLGYMNCNDKQFTDTIDMVKAWREFITQNTIFMLKSPKGDVLLVNVVDAPSTTYEENVSVIPTKISFNWAECGKIEDIEIHQEYFSNY
jgi:hypothetical protein